MGNKKFDMFYSAPKETFLLAKRLRETMTEEEEKLWLKLKGNQIQGLKFRRQHPIGRFIVDFYCHKVKLVLEVDGKIHLSPSIHLNDKERQKEIESLGIKVIRFKNSDVCDNIEKVLLKIKSECEFLLKNT